MIKVCIVGQNPANKMKTGDMPFKGTKSLDTLKVWLNKLEVDPNIMLFNASDKEGKVTPKDVNELAIRGILNTLGMGYKVIAVGSYASKALSKYNIPHYKLPHPSGKNRLLNSKEYIDQELEKCYNWLRQEVVQNFEVK